MAKKILKRLRRQYPKMFGPPTKKERAKVQRRLRRKYPQMFEDSVRLKEVYKKRDK